MKSLNEIFFISFILLLSMFQNVYSQWHESSDGIEEYHNVFQIAANGSHIFAVEEFYGVYVSTNNGQNWSLSNIGLPDSVLFSQLGVCNGNIFIGAGRSIYKSSNNGISWFEVKNGLPDKVYSFYTSGTDIYAGSFARIYYSNNNGISWNMFNYGGASARSILWHNSALYVSANGQTDIAKTSNYGITWQWFPISGVVCFLSNMTNSGGYLFIGTTIGVYRTINGGINWLNFSSGLPNNTVAVIRTINNTLITGIAGINPERGVYISTDNGINWVSKNEGSMNTNSVYSFAVNDNYIFAGTGSVWRRARNEVINISNISTEIPVNYSLSQNYPNPFNSQTKINFAIKKNELVKINIYDISGKILETIVNQYLTPGTYQTQWNAANYSSGIFFYKIITENYSLTKKMVLTK